MKLQATAGDVIEHLNEKITENERLKSENEALIAKIDQL